MLRRSLLFVLALFALLILPGLPSFAETATTTLTLGEPRAIPPYMFGYNVDRTIRGVARDDPAYNAALAALKPATIRFQGGTIANYWDYERADFVCSVGETYQLINNDKLPCVLPNSYQHHDPLRHTLATVKTELERSGAKAILVLNMLTQHLGQEAAALEYAMAMLHRAEELGIAIDYIELGNEFYLLHGDRNTSKNYAAAFPNAKKLAAGSWRYARRFPAQS